MQPTGGGITASAGGGELRRGPGLTRFRSAPTTWLEALLESDTEDDFILEPSPALPFTKPPQPPHPHPSSHQLKPEPLAGGRYSDLGLFDSAGGGGGGGASGGLGGFVRQNSSPAEFLSVISSDGYLSNLFGPADFDYVSPQLDASVSAKRAREADSDDNSGTLPSQLKGEQSGPLHAGISSSLDADMDKLMEDLVPCRVRAKRGCATHPRSIAERVRRTRISDRIRKLQELVPNMDKQTNTADMLDEAVDYVKSLQSQIQELTEQQKNCTCSIKQE